MNLFDGFCHFLLSLPPVLDLLDPAVDLTRMVLGLALDLSEGGVTCSRTSVTYS